jgi:1-phosphatidylinositol phosphodiesterase
MSIFLTNLKDYYDVSADIPKGSGPTAYIQAKFNVTTAHITEAETAHPDQLYISFASAVFIDDQPAMTPQVCLSTTRKIW